MPDVTGALRTSSYSVEVAFYEGYPWGVNESEAQPIKDGELHIIDVSDEKIPPFWNQRVGFAAITQESRNCYIAGVRLDPDCQKRGIATRGLQAMIRVMPKVDPTAMAVNFCFSPHDKPMFKLTDRLGAVTTAVSLNRKAGMIQRTLQFAGFGAEFSLQGADRA